MPTVSAPRSGRRRRGEEGLTLVELAMAGVLGVALLTTIAVATTAVTHSSRAEVQQGVTTGNAIVAIQAVQQALSAAWTPGSTSGVSSQCAGGRHGEAWESGTGPFVSVEPSDIVFCGFRNNSSTPYTYELHFTDCEDHLCTLVLDQQGAPGCSPHCLETTVYTDTGVSDAGTPFAYYTSSGGSWAPTTNLSQIQAVQVTLTIPALGPSGKSEGNGSQVQRLLILPNTLGGAS
jgi:hypothetical protein